MSDMMCKYFAYGSNMSSKIMSETCPEHHYLGRAMLQNFRLRFSRRSIRWNAGVADCVPTKGAVVWGALYEIGRQDMGALDRREGYPDAYKRIDVRVNIGECVQENAFIYTVVAKEEEEIHPKNEYVELMIEGAMERELPKRYVAFLESLKEPKRYQTPKDFLVIGTESRVEAEGMPLLKVCGSTGNILHLGETAAVVYGGKACLAKVAHLEAMDESTCQLDQNARHALGIPGRGAYGAFVSLFPVSGMLTQFPFVKPRSLVLPLHRPSWLDSEKNICVLHPNNIRLLGLVEGEYVVLQAVLADQLGKWKVKKITVRVFGGSGHDITRGGDLTEYPKIDEVYLDLDIRNALGIAHESYNIPIAVSPAVSRLFTSRLLYYGIALFLAMVALVPILQELAYVAGLSKMFGLVATVVLSALVTSVLCIFDIRSKVQY